MQSNHKYVLALSDEAYDDLISVQNYTYAQHGEKKWREYGTDLDKSMDHILGRPFSGHTRDDIPNSYQASTVCEHVMIYRAEDKTIYLVRILHGKMNFTFQFQK